MFEKHAKDEKSNEGGKSESKATSRIIYSFPRPLFSSQKRQA